MNKMYLLFLLCFLGIVITPAAAGVNTIPASGTVFLGEDDLDISATGVPPNSNIVWYGTGGTIGSAPSGTVFVTDPTSFYVSPVLFEGKTGPWFTESGNVLAFYVQEPQISLRVFDHTAGFEITPSTVWVPKGDIVGFQIDNTVYVLANRPTSPGAPVTIRIRGPGGIEYSAVDSFSLEDIMVNSPNYQTGPVWYTGDYQSGNYTVWVESTGNDMNDNYPREGQTISTQVTFLMQSTNPSITPTPTPTTIPTTVPPTVPTTVPPTPTPGFGITLTLVAMAAGLIGIHIRK
ncbi:MAG: DUF3821 domain-containing protein [Methanomicrobiales archaeon]|nr:DUF3821 domain-containing protein [Methanomicrobiales archaeon]